MGRSITTKRLLLGGYEPNGRCCIRGCGGEIWGHEFCRPHYQAWRDNGHPLHSQGRVSKPSTAKTSTREYKSWWSARARCSDPSKKNYGNYGGRGIRMCERWSASFDAFLADVGKAPTRRHTLDRKDVNGHYEPGNCRWATPAEQTRNRRTTCLSAEIVAQAKARRLRGDSVADIARSMGVSYGALQQCLRGNSWVDVAPAGEA